jgi:hypothetical protein
MRKGSKYMRKTDVFKYEIWYTFSWKASEVPFHRLVKGSLMATPTVDLAALNPLLEIVIRAGDTSVGSARTTLQTAYLARDMNYPDTIGMSTLFRVGATFDELAREGSYPHKKISFSIIGKIREELQQVGFDLVLFITPTRKYPDHHALAVAHGVLLKWLLLMRLLRLSFVP